MDLGLGFRTAEQAAFTPRRERRGKIPRTAQPEAQRLAGVLDFVAKLSLSSAQQMRLVRSLDLTLHSVSVECPIADAIKRGEGSNGEVTDPDKIISLTIEK